MVLARRFGHLAPARIPFLPIKNAHPANRPENSANTNIAVAADSNPWLILIEELDLLTGCKRFPLINEVFGMVESLKQGEVSRLLAAIRLVESRAPARTILTRNLPQRYLDPLVVNRDERAHGPCCIAAHFVDVAKCKQQLQGLAKAVTFSKMG